MRLENALEMNTTADRCWHILAEEFGEIDRWAANIAKSYLKDPAVGLLGNVRTCEIPSFGTLHERITTFDPEARKVGYVIEGMPKFVRKTTNTWYVRPVGPKKAVVGSIFEFETAGFLGKLMGPMLRRQLSKGTNGLLEEFRAYAETGQVHSRTARAKQKQMKKPKLAA